MCELQSVYNEINNQNLGQKSFIVLKNQNLVTNLQNQIFVKVLIYFVYYKEERKLFKLFKLLITVTNLKKVSSVPSCRKKVKQNTSIIWSGIFLHFRGIFRQSCGLFLLLERNIPSVASKFFPSLSME